MKDVHRRWRHENAARLALGLVLCFLFRFSLLLFFELFFPFPGLLFRSLFLFLLTQSPSFFFLLLRLFLCSLCGLRGLAFRLTPCGEKTAEQSHLNSPGLFLRV